MYSKDGVTIKHVLSIKDIYENKVVAISIPRKHVEERDLKMFDRTFKKFLQVGKDAAGKMVVSFDGYEDTKDEVYEIPEIRIFVTKILNKYPYLLYYVCTEEPFAMQNGDILLACMGDVEAYRPVDAQIFEEYRLKITVPEEYQWHLINGAVSHGRKLGDSSIAISDRLAQIRSLYVIRQF